MTTTRTTNYPDVPLPPATQAYTHWEQGPTGAQRIPGAINAR